MTLATTCPTCKTSFRVVPDQLKLRRGLVRCGACHCVFSGVDALRHLPDEPAAEPVREDTVVLPAQHRDPDAERPSSVAVAFGAAPPPGPLPGPPPAPAAAPVAETSAAATPLASAHAPADAAIADDRWASLRAFPEPAATAPGIANEQPPPDADTADVATTPRSATGAAWSSAKGEEDAIDFFATGSGRRVGWKPRSALGRVVALVLLLLLAAQLALGGRDWLSAWFPPMRPWLDQLVRPFGLEVELLRRPEAVTIESFELTGSDVPGTYRMSALLRSRADTPVQWPAIELSLTDASGAVVVRRVLTAQDYIADPAVIAAGLPGRSEYPVLVGMTFEHLTPTGYSALLFYP